MLIAGSLKDNPRIATPVVRHPPGLRHPRGANIADLAVRTVVGAAPCTEKPQILDLIPVQTSFLKSLFFVESLPTIREEDLTFEILNFCKTARLFLPPAKIAANIPA